MAAVAACWNGGGGFTWHSGSGAGAANADPLGDLNNLNCYNLSDKLNSYYGNDINTNPYLTLNIESNYFDIENFIAKFANTEFPINLSLNIRSLQCNHLNLLTLVNEFLKNNIKIDIIALQEIWQIQHSESVDIPGFNFVYCQRNISRGGGIGFYIADKFSHKILNNLSTFVDKTFESLTIQLTLKNKKSIITNIYRSPTSHLAVFCQNLDELLNNLSILNLESTVFLDSNINLLNVDRNQQAVDYLQIIHSNSFLQIIGKATRISNQTYSLIDHILKNKSEDGTSTGVILTDISDHFMTFSAKLKKTSKVRNPLQKIRDLSLANINKFKTYLYNFNWGCIYNSDNVNETYNIFSDVITTGFDLHFPLKTLKFNKNYHKINDFMTNGLLISRKQKNLLFKLSLTSKNPELKLKYQNYRNIYNSLVRLSKKLYYEQSFLKYKSNSKKTWELLNEITSRSKTKFNKITEINVQGHAIREPSEIANNFNNFFTNIGTQIADSVRDTKTDPCLNLPDIDSNIKFDIGSTGPTHILDIINSLPSKNSTDLSGISTKFLKNISYQICSPLAHIFSLSLEQGIFPEKLKTSRTVPIFKSGDRSNIDNFRPISLVNTFSKILEKIVALKLTNYLEINKLISPWQFGFQKNINTEHNLINVTNFIGNALNNGEYCIGIFFDLKKAFDVVQHHILLPKLKRMGITENSLLWFESYLKNRKQVVDIDGTLSKEKNIDCSVLQGSILGPLLFLCFINDFPHSTILKSFMFADDTTCLISGKNLNELINLVNIEIQKIALWYRNNKMAVNTSKTKYIIFHSRGRTFDRVNDIFYNSNDYGNNNPENIALIERICSNNPDPNLRYYKLLGVFFDEHLTFNKHIDHICSKLSKSIFFLRRAKNFINNKSLITLYYALFHSHLLYCINITGCSNKTSINKISLLQKKAIRIITNSHVREHCDPLFESLGIFPFHKLITQSRLNFMHTIFYNTAHRSFLNTWTKNSERNLEINLRNDNNFFIPPVHLEIFRRIPIYSFAKSWNELGDIKFQRNKFTFASELKSKLRENSLSALSFIE